MSELDNIPSNRNFISPLNFEFRIKKSPNVNFFLQKVNIPGIMAKDVITTNPFVNVPYPGEHISFNNLKIEFKVDEDLKNYLEINNWLQALGKPQTFDQYAEIEKKPVYTGEGIYSDISLISLTSSKMPNYEIVFIDAFPISIADITFNSTDPDVNYISATAEFKYSYYNISKVF